MIVFRSQHPSVKLQFGALFFALFPAVLAWFAREAASQASVKSLALIFGLVFSTAGAFMALELIQSLRKKRGLFILGARSCRIRYGKLRKHVPKNQIKKLFVDDRDKNWRLVLEEKNGDQTHIPASLLLLNSQQVREKLATYPFFISSPFQS